MVLVDTSVWSLALRRAGEPSAGTVKELTALIREGHAAILGAIRQELLSGIRSARQFDTLRTRMRAYPDIRVDTADYEDAAALFNRCRARGIQGSNTDFLLCAVAMRHDIAIFTTDRDFARFARVVPVRLHAARR